MAVAHTALGWSLWDRPDRFWRCSCGDIWLGVFCRYSDNAEALQNMKEALFFAHFREVVLTAERSLLYALGFQLGIHHPYYWITSILSRLSKLPGEDGEWWAAYSTRTVSPWRHSQQNRPWPAQAFCVSTGTVTCLQKASATLAGHAGRSWGMATDGDGSYAPLAGEVSDQLHQ